MKLHMIKNAILFAIISLLSIVLMAFAPEDIEYPHLSKFIAERSDIRELGIKTIRGDVTVLQGFRYAVDSDICPGNYRVKNIDKFSFYAKLEEGKWTVMASEDQQIKLSKEDMLISFGLTLDSLAKQCRHEHKTRQSWASEQTANQDK